MTAAEYDPVQPDLEQYTPEPESIVPEPETADEDLPRDEAGEDEKYGPTPDMALDGDDG